jgi:hypothetical protein
VEKPDAIVPHRGAPIQRRTVLKGALVVVGATAAGAAGASAGLRGLPGRGLARGDTVAVPVTYAAGGAIWDSSRLALRALWDAVVPGIWEGNVEDGGQPGADQTYVQAWLEQVAVNYAGSISWLTTGFLNAWGIDLNAWARVNTWFMQNFDSLPLGTSIVWPATRQGKIRLMLNLLVPGIATLTNLQYFGAILLARLAFFCDFYFEANYPQISVGRAYCGAHLPPGTTPYPTFSFKLALGKSNPNLIVVNGKVSAP